MRPHPTGSRVLSRDQIIEMSLDIEFYYTTNEPLTLNLFVGLHTAAGLAAFNLRVSPSSFTIVSGVWVHATSDQIHQSPFHFPIFCRQSKLWSGC